MVKTKEELIEARKQKLPTATTFSPRNSLSNLSSSNSDATRQSRSKFHFALAAPSLSSPLGLPKEFAQMEQKLKEMHTKEDDSLFYYHSSEDRIVLSHAMFWTMTQLQFFKGKMRKEKFFLLLRQYEEEMLDAFLQEDDYFPELTSLTFVTTRQN